MLVLAGGRVIVSTGALAVTVNVALALVALPAPLLTTTRKTAPVSATAAATSV